MRTMISFAALFASIFLVQLGGGTMGPLDALAGVAHGFSRSEIGGLGSAHYVGFFVGCWATPRLLGMVGHTRAFAALTACIVISVILHPVFVTAYGCMALGALAGFGVAGAYTVVESWLHAKLTNDTRGQTLGAYRVVDLGGSMVAQLMIAFLDPSAYISYNILAALCCLALMPILLSRSAPSVIGDAPRLRPLKALRLSPLAAAGVVVSGATSAAFRMVGPLYGAERGFSQSELALFMGFWILGGAVSQIPIGRIADKMDRRNVLMLVSVASCLACAGLAVGIGGNGGFYALSFAFGAAALPLYSISAAHANDFAPPDFVVELNAALMFLFGVGAIVSPLLAANLIAGYGPAALFAYIGAAHLGLIGFSLFRMTRRPTRGPRTPYRYTPRTTFVLGRLLRRRSDGSAAQATEER